MINTQARGVGLKNIVKFRKSLSTSSNWEQPAIGYDTGIKLFNCVARRKVPLILRHKNVATWYSCGPTVYDSAHIGHASCFVKQDLLQRILRKYFHINLVTAMNITDIDDKIIRRAQENGELWQDLASRYETEFWDDLRKLSVLEPDIKVRVSNCVPEIISFIKRLIDNGSAYVAIDGSVYFNVSTHAAYGKLQNISPTEQQEHEQKLNAQDFALWKSAKANEPSWPAPWGNGRPGWHIECSTMASSIFGATIDFHSGGLDLRFPHHENEETQSCAYHNVKQWINYWVHIGKLHVGAENVKMSKSLKNTISIAELLVTYSAEQFRMFCVMSSYQHQMDFRSDSMNMAGTILKKIREYCNDVNAYANGARPFRSFNVADLILKIAEIDRRIDDALKDNFNTSQSIHHLMELITYVNKLVQSTSDESRCDSRSNEIGALVASSNFVGKYLDIFGFERSVIGRRDGQEFNYENLLNNLVDIRNSIRSEAVSGKNKDLFKVCDNIRDVLKMNGVVVKDHGKLSSWSLLDQKK